MPYDPNTERLEPASGESVRLTRSVLVLVAGPEAGRRIPYDGGTLTLGSGEGVEARLGGRGISRRHAEIVAEKGQVLLRDLGSTNGTFVNASKVKEVFLAGGDVIRIGDAEMRFETKTEEVRIPASLQDHFGPVYGKSLPMRKLFGVLERVARSDASVLMLGESGTGKDLVARSLHAQSPRRDGPFIVVDASTQNPDLLGSELFGHLQGSFTGAQQARKGAFEAASGGTVFLDEIGELPLDLQPAFLRVLENREVRPVGANTPIPVDVRILAATHRDLPALVKAGKFREDLYYRLAVVQVKIPPLRERREDLPGLVSALLCAMKTRGEPPAFTPEALRVLAAHSWPGNIRELRNVIECTMALAAGPTLDSRDLMLAGAETHDGSQTGGPGALAGKTLEEIEKEAIRLTLESTGGNQSEAARVLGLHRNGLAKKMKRYGID